MNKRKILFVVIFGVISLLSYLGYNIISKSNEKNEIAKQLQTIPAFSFQTLDLKPFTNSNLKQNIPTIFIYFNSECDYCKYEAESIGNNLDKFKNVQLIFVSTENIETIRQFSEKNKLNNQTNITFLYDSDYLFSNQFDAQTIPYILIYSKKQKLIKKHKGQLKIEAIVKLIKN